jgi:CDP-diacylglycerol---glycerol-3-phosphate 3-phosphatidyltransferase
MVAVLALILHDSYYMDYGFWEGIVDMNAVGLGLLYLSVFFTITSAGEYVALLVDAVEAKDRRLAEQSDADG